MTHEDESEYDAEAGMAELRRQMAAFRLSTFLEGGLFGFGLGTPPEEIYLDRTRCREILESPEYRTDAFRIHVSNALH